MLVALSSFSLVLASLSLVAAAPHEQGHGLVKKSHHNAAAHHHQKRFSGRATWYDVGLGACGDYNGPSDYIVALNSHQLDTSVYPPVQCGRKVRITYEGKSAVATVKDECPGCPFGALDMSKGLFTHFTGLGTGVFYMDWEWTDGSGGDDNNDGGKKDDNKDDNKKDDDDKEDKPKTTTTHRTTTTTTRKTTTTTTTTTTTKKSTSSTTTTTTTTSSSSSSAAPTSSKTPDDDDVVTQTDNTVSYIANQQQFIANLGYMSSVGKSS